MAMLKTRTRFKVTGSYWVITRLEWNKETNKTFCFLACFKDEQARDAGLSNELKMLSTYYNISGAVSLEQAYPIIKSTVENPFVPKSFFADAVDC